MPRSKRWPLQFRSACPVARAHPREVCPSATRRLCSLAEHRSTRLFRRPGPDGVEPGRDRAARTTSRDMPLPGRSHRRSAAILLRISRADGRTLRHGPQCGRRPVCVPSPIQSPRTLWPVRVIHVRHTDDPTNGRSCSMRASSTRPSHTSGRPNLRKSCTI